MYKIVTRYVVYAYFLAFLVSNKFRIKEQYFISYKMGRWVFMYFIHLKLLQAKLNKNIGMYRVRTSGRCAEIVDYYLLLLPMVLCKSRLGVRVFLNTKKKTNWMSFESRGVRAAVRAFRLVRRM